MKLKIKFYIKLFIYNPLFVIYLLFNLFLLYKQSPSLKYNPLIFSEVFCFGFIVSNLFLVIISTFLMNKKYEILELYEKNKFNKQKCIIISGMIISLLTTLPTILIIIIFLFNKYSLIYILSIIIHFLILWNLSNFISICIGSTIGNVLNSKFCYIFSLLSYSFFIIRLYYLSSSIFYNLLNIYDDTTIIASYKNNTTFDLAYVIDKLFVIVLAILILNIGCLFLSNHKNKKNNVLIIFLFLILISIFIIIYFIIQFNTI